MFLKKTFLFVYDIYVENFIIKFLCVYVFYPELVHPLPFSPFYLSLLMLISSDLKILFYLLVIYMHVFIYVDEKST
jgi:hypothetical protein